MQIVIDIPEEIYGRCRKYELHCGEAEVLEGAVANGTPISDNVTNGDVIRAFFPNLYSYDGENYVLLDLSGFCRGKIEQKWWDAPYKVESEE